MIQSEDRLSDYNNTICKLNDRIVIKVIYITVIYK